MTGLVSEHAHVLNTTRLAHNGRRFAEDILKNNYLTENDHILIKFSLKFVSPGLIDNHAPLV